MPPLISSTTGIGDEKFNLTVKPYQIPTQKESGQIQISSFYRQVTGLAAGNTVTNNISLGTVRSQKILIQKIEFNAFLTTSANAPKTLNTLVLDATMSGISNWGISAWLGDNTYFNNSIKAFSSPGSTDGLFVGPVLITPNAGAVLSFDFTAYATFTLNDIIRYMMNIYWQPVA